MADQVTNYQCPACTGPLQFSATTGKLECEFCGSSFTVEEVEALYAEKDAKAEAAFAKAEEAEQEASSEEENQMTIATEEESAPETKAADSQWDYSELGAEEWSNEETASMKVFSCPSCGAELVCEATTAATSCPYCGNQSIVPGQFGGDLKPDLIIPFKLDKDAAIKALKQHYRGKILLPRAFTNGNHLKEIQGIYVPFWLYDAKVNVDCTLEYSTSHVHTEGSYEITETSFYEADRKGSVSFTNVPVDASKKMDNDYMDSLEPFDYSELKPFSTAYLPGFLADRYDQSAKQCAKRANARCENSAIAAMVADVTGHENVKPFRSEVDVQRGKVRYALLPVWTLHTDWEGKSYLFMMNGQTGKFVGNLPSSKKKLKAITAGVFAGVTAFFYFTGIGRIISSIAISAMMAD